MPIQKGQKIAMDYEGRLKEKIWEVFDSSEFPKPFQLNFGEDKVIEGWNIGIASMKVGEKAQLTIGPEYAYGKAGSPPKIPEDATLVFNIEILQVDDKTSKRTILV